MKLSSTPLSKASKIIEKDSKDERKKLLKEKRDKFMQDFERSKLKNSTFNKLLVNKRVQKISGSTETIQRTSFNTLAVKNREEILVALSNSRSMFLHQGTNLDQVRIIMGESSGIRDTIYMNGKYYLYNSSTKCICTIDDPKSKNPKIKKVVDHNGNAFVGSIMRKSLDEDNVLLLSKEWNSLVHFDTRTLKKFTIMERLGDGEIFYDHASLQGKRVILGTRKGKVKLIKYDPTSRTSELLDEMKAPRISFETRGVRRERHHGGGVDDYSLSEQIARISVCPRGKIVAFNCWHRTSEGYYNSSINFIQIKGGRKLAYKMKYMLRNFKIDPGMIKRYNERSGTRNSIGKKSKLAFFQAFRIQGYRGQCVFVCGISFKDPSLLFTFGYNVRANKIVSKRVEEIDSVGSILQMKMFDRELFTVNDEGRLFNLG